MSAAGAGVVRRVVDEESAYRWVKWPESLVDTADQAYLCRWRKRGRQQKSGGELEAERTILIRNDKNRAERVIPLTVRAQAILAGRLRERKGVVVFPTQEFKRSLDSAGRRAVIGHVTLTNYVIPSPP